MLTGKQFQLKAPALALDSIGGKRVTVTVPEGTTIKIVAGPHGSDRMVDVLWQGQTVIMFALDVREYGIEIADQNPYA